MVCLSAQSFTHQHLHPSHLSVSLGAEHIETKDEPFLLRRETLEPHHTLFPLLDSIMTVMLPSRVPASRCSIVWSLLLLVLTTTCHVEAATSSASAVSSCSPWALSVGARVEKAWKSKKQQQQQTVLKVDCRGGATAVAAVKTMTARRMEAFK